MNTSNFRIPASPKGKKTLRQRYWVPGDSLRSWSRNTTALISFCGSRAAGSVSYTHLDVYKRQDKTHFWLYCLLASVGSAIGGLLPYALGRAGGELFLLKRVNRKHYERIRARFERQEFLAMMIPSMLQMCIRDRC